MEFCPKSLRIVKVKRSTTVETLPNPIKAFIIKRMSGKKKGFLSPIDTYEIRVTEKHKHSK